MKRIIVMTAGLAVVAAGVVGCLSAQLRSEDPQTRLAAVGEVKEQAVLQEIAQGAQYQDDVRVAAMKRLSDQQDLWRIWSENEDTPEIARGALEAFKDDDYLVRVSLSSRTNEALVAVGRLSSLSACSNVAVNCTVPSVQLAAFRKFLEQTTDEDALRYVLEHGKMRGASVEYAPSAQDGARSRPASTFRAGRMAKFQMPAPRSSSTSSRTHGSTSSLRATPSPSPWPRRPLRASPTSGCSPNCSQPPVRACRRGPLRACGRSRRSTRAWTRSAAIPLSG